MIIQGLFAIDDFRERSSGLVYLLSHHHSDHLRGLHKNFPYPVFASKQTCRMLAATHPKVSTVSFDTVNEWYSFEGGSCGSANALGREILVVSANHLRGSVSFYFPRCPLHESCFYSSDWRPNSVILDVLKRNKVHVELGTAYLDATFQHQHYDWPTHADSLKLFRLFCNYFHSKHPSTPLNIGVHHPGQVLILVFDKKTFKIHESVPVSLRKKLELHYPEFIDAESKFVVVKPTNFFREDEGPVLVPCTLYFACEGKFRDARRITRDERGHYRLAFSLHANFKENLFVAETLRPKNLQFIHEKKIDLKCKKLVRSASSVVS